MGNILSEPKLEKESKKTIIYYSDEEQYIGECNGEVREGTGVYTYANGDKYEGQWLNNVKQGKGYFYYNNGELYIGDWVKNKKCGKGMYFYQTGDRFDGEWEDNMKQGEGTYYYVDGTIYHGHFKNSKKHGVGTMKTPEGFVYEEVWEEGQLLTRKIIQKPEPGPDSKAKKITRQKSVTVVKNFAKKPRKPRVTENGLTFMSHLDVSQYVNEKLLHKNINEWKTKDVCDWLDRGGFSQYKDNFSSNHITGRNLFDLTENDLKDDFNITNAVHRKRIMQDLELLKKIYSKNSDDNQYIRNKLLRFYEKNQGELFTKKNAAASSRTSINLGGVMVAPGEIGDEMTIRDKELKDVKDKQDTLEDVSLEQKMVSSSTSSSSSESSSNEEQNEAMEKEAPGKKIKNQANKGPESEQEEEKPQLHMSEYRTILDNYQKNDFNLLETIKKTLGKMSVIDYSELEMAQSIGEGGYGEVFKGKWLGQDVAIKVYGRKKVRNKEKIDQDFLREVEVVSRLRHPNIVLFMGVSLTPQGKGFLITEYLEGGSLFDHLHKKGTKFDETTIINIALDIALGMNYLHGQKILHCDLKSSNILLDEHFNVKLADFGLSKSKRKIHGRKHFKRVGTPHWMAPEIMREEEYDEASDVYSYGMIIWELMVKKVPYFGLKVNQIVGSVGYGDKQVPIPETGNEIMITLMKQCLCKTRSGRPTFREITEYLKDTDRHRKLIAMRELDSFFN